MIGANTYQQYACGWHDLKLKTIVSNVGTTLPGNAAVRHRHKIVIVDGEEITIRHDKLIKRPRMIEDFLSFSVHDHLRQGSLRMEEAWKTKKWWHRLFGTVFGIILTDCYLAYKMTKMRHSSAPPASFSIFLGRLCKQMIDNDHVRQTRSASGSNQTDQVPGDCLDHQCAQLIKHKIYRELAGTDSRPRIKCKIDGCKFKTGTYCITCSKFNEVGCRNDVRRVTDVIAICSSSTGRDCYAKHLAKFTI